MPQTPKSRFGLEQFLYNHEYEIRSALKAIHNRHTFSVDGILQTQRHYRKILKTQSVSVGAIILHRDWNSIDRGRASAACVLEQFRTRAWVLGELRTSLTSTNQNLHHLTFADTADRVESGNLSAFNLANYQIRIRRILSKLKRNNPRFWAFGIVEISARFTNTDSVLFEPHCHILIDNASAEAVRSAFKSAVRATASSLHPVQLKSVSSPADLARVLGYFVKFVPERRSEVLGRRGRPIKGRSNLMTGLMLREWLGWMAAHRTHELLIKFGLSSALIENFEHSDLQLIIGELLRRSVNRAV